MTADTTMKHTKPCEVLLCRKPATHAIKLPWSTAFPCCEGCIKEFKRRRADYALRLLNGENV